MKKRNFLTLLLMVIGIAFIFTSCVDSVVVKECVDTTKASGFWWGLWNGITVFFSFIGSLFSDNIAIYDVNNNGGWYDFGYFIGLGGLGFVFGRSGK